MAEDGPEEGPRTELSRDLSCFTITMIGVGAMIGAGIFVLTGIAAGTAGPALILAFALNGVVTIFTAMVYAELGSAIPEAGGGYLWVSEGLPGGNAFLAGWMSWFAHAVAGSLYALGFGAYFGLMLGEFHLTLFGLEGALMHKTLGVAIALLFVFINYRGASETGTAGNIVTVLKVVIIALFIGSGLWRVIEHPEGLSHLTPFAPKGLTGVFTAMGLTFIAFEGYEIIVQAGEEVKDPRRNVPRAVFWSIAIVVPIYILVAFVALAAVNPGTGEPTWLWLGGQGEIGIAEAARQFMPFGTTLLLVGGLLSTISALNATTFSSTRVAFAMGRARNLPAAFGRVSGKTKTPVVALLASGAIIVLMVIAVPIEDVAAAADVMFLLLFLQVNVAVISIRRKYGDKLDYGYLTPFFPAVPIVAIVLQAFLALFMFHFSPLAWFVAGGWIGGGVLLYYLYARSRDREKTATPVLAGERIPRKKERFRILVPVANPDTVEGLLGFALRLAKARDGEVIVLHCVTTPRQLPYEAGRELYREVPPAVRKARRYLAARDVPAHTLVRLTHRAVWRGIVDSIADYDVDFLVMGWKGRPGDPEVAVGKHQEKVVRRSNCDAAVIQNPADRQVRRILVPVEEQDEGDLLLTVACLSLSRPAKGRIDLLHVVEDEERRGPGPEEYVARLKERVAEWAGEERSPPEIEVLVTDAPNPAGEILKRAGDYDVVMLGAARDSWISRRLFGNVPRRVANRSEKPVVLVSRRTHPVKYSVQALSEFFRDVPEEEELAEEE